MTQAPSVELTAAVQGHVGHLVIYMYLSGGGGGAIVHRVLQQSTGLCLACRLMDTSRALHVFCEDAYYERGCGGLHKRQKTTRSNQEVPGRP